jgi:membrane fusion protein (multidrug efflux system)
MSGLILCAACLIAVGCERRADAPPGKAPPSPVQTVSLVRPHRGEISRTIALPGNVLAYQRALICAKVAGYLKKITVDKGDAVKEGDLLADIEVPELLADEARFRAEVEVAGLDYQRIKEAQAKAPDLVVVQTVDNAKARVDVAKANLERNETLLQYAKIKAPFSGMITRRLVDPGAFIPAATSGGTSSNAALVELMDFERVRVQVGVPETEVPHIANGLPVKLTVEELPGRTFPGSVTRFAEALDDATKTMLAEIELPNPDHSLRPGMYATVQIEVEKRTGALLVPRDAVLIEKAKTSVFVVEGTHARKVSVKTGFMDASAVELVEGIKPDEPVILLGKLTLNDGQPVQSTEAK